MARHERPTRRRVVFGGLGLAAGLGLPGRLEMTGPIGQASAQADPESVPPIPDGFTLGPTARVATVVDGDTVTLDDGRDARLIGMQAPKLALGRDGFADWPLAHEARDRLADLVDGRGVTLAYGGAREDRYGRHLAHLVRDDGLWLQGAVMAAGMARVYSFADNRTGVRDLLALESAARGAGAGIWTHPFYAIRQADQVADLVDTYQLVEGTPIDVGRGGGRVFLNYGRDWSVDFTPSLREETLDSFRQVHLNPFQLAGQRLRVRGWITWHSGPAIDLTHPEQIEVI
jgi:endonuclease YncB( thermonuclease family)